MAVSKKKVLETKIEINEDDVVESEPEEFTACILGTSPIVFNRMAEKARHELLFPRGRMSKGERAVRLKHDPLEEYRSSVYRRSVNQAGPTRLQFPAAAFKRAAATAALHMPGVAKTEIDRLSWALGHRVDIYGVPMLFSDIVRMADMKRTPDVRTWAILPKWACYVTFQVESPFLSARIFSRLLASAGRIVGVGDGRQEKGKRSNGQFALANADDPAFLEVIKTGGMAAQDKALMDPECYDTDTEDLYQWFQEEYDRRARNLPRSGDEDDDEREDESLDEAAE